MSAFDHQDEYLPDGANVTLNDRHLFDHSIEKAVIVDRAGFVIRCNQNAQQLLKVSKDTIVSDQLALPGFFCADDQIRIDEWINRLFQVQAALSIDVSLNRQGKPVQLRLVGQQLPEQQQFAQVLFQERSKEDPIQTELLHMAYYDPLTQLPNRHLLMDRLQQAILDAKRHREKLAVLLVDLDHFKRINDTLGHVAGDQMLQNVSQNVHSVLRDADTMARFGGDEFIVFAQHLSTDHDAALLATRILDAIDQPVKINDVAERISASVGISLYPQDATDIDALIHKADIALYRVKKAGRCGYAFFNSEMEQMAAHQKDFERSLRKAIDQNEICLYYQPIVAANTCKMIAFEALLRWRSPVNGLLTASEFLPIAETIGLDRQLTDWAIREACQQVQQWRQKGLIGQENPCQLTVNLSSRQLTSPHIGPYISEMMQLNGLSSNDLVMEIHEADFKRPDRSIQKTLATLNQQNIQIYLDDFCEGFCQLIDSSQLDFTTIKLSQRITRRLFDLSYGELLLSSLIKLAHAANKKVIAEGVESQVIYQRLVHHGCDAMQGFWLSHPVPAMQMEMLLEASA